MINILSRRDQRYLLILESLLKNEYTTSRELSRITGTSKRNIQEDLKIINTFISPMNVDTSQKNGYFLTTPNNYSIDYIYRCVLANSIEFSLLESIFFQKYSSLAHYADKLFISVSSLKRMIASINNVVSKMGFKISTTPISIIGNEKKISSIMNFYFAERYETDKLPFSKFQIRSLDAILSKNLSKNNNHLNFPDLNMVRIIILVSLTRIQTGHLATEQLQVPDNFDTTFITNFFSKKVFKSIFKIEPTKEVLYQLVFPFYNGQFAHNYEDLLRMSENNTTIHKTVINIQHFLENISHSINIPLINQEILTLELFNVLNLIVGKSYVIYNQKRRFLDNFIHNDPYLAKYMYSLLQSSSKLARMFEIYELEEIAYILITHWKDFGKKMLTLKPKYSVGIFMSSDIEHSNLIAITLNRQFSEEFTFTVMNSLTIKEVLKEATNFDLVLTNISGLSHPKSRFICIEFYPSFNDFKKIRNVYTQLNDR